MSQCGCDMAWLQSPHETASFINGCFQKKGVGPPNHPFVHRVFHEINPSILGGKIPLFLVQHPNGGLGATAD